MSCQMMYTIFKVFIYLYRSDSRLKNHTAGGSGGDSSHWKMNAASQHRIQRCSSVSAITRMGLDDMLTSTAIQNIPSTVVKATLHVWCCGKTPTEQRGGVSKAHYHLKTHALKRRAENRAVFDQVKLVFSYNTNENF